ncbi:AGAP011389-PA, partial [Anopheles gambiae str. PEST]
IRKQCSQNNSSFYRTSRHSSTSNEQHRWAYFCSQIHHTKQQAYHIQSYLSTTMYPKKHSFERGNLYSRGLFAASGLGLGEDPTKPIDCKNNPIEVDKYTNAVLRTAHPGLYAMGPLVGDNFVRFIPGGALCIT